MQRLEVGVCESPTRSSDSPVKNLFNVTDAVSRLDSNAVCSQLFVLVNNAVFYTVGQKTCTLLCLE